MTTRNKWTRYMSILIRRYRCMHHIHIQFIYALPLKLIRQFNCACVQNGIVATASRGLSCALMNIIPPQGGNIIYNRWCRFRMHDVSTLGNKAESLPGVNNINYAVLSTIKLYKYEI